MDRSGFRDGPSLHLYRTRPRVTISIIAPDHALDQELLTLDLPPGLSIADLKGFVNAETQIPQTRQQFYLNNVPIQGDSKTLEEVGIHDGDMLAMMVRQQQSNQHGAGASGNPQQRASQQQRQAGPGQRRQNTTLGEEEIETTRRSILANSGAMAQVREQRPALAEAINDSTRFRQVWLDMIQEDEARENERQEQMRLLNEDPFNIEAQRRIEEMIRQQSVQENLQHAYEHNPEVFGRVTMLYIPVHVNKHPVKAFVDSGAQTTIMSPSCAEACGIMRLIDKRYSGVARGVGTAQILGRVHSADIKIGKAVMPCSFTVMEGKDVDLLLGLDMLKRFQACIDLKRNKLIFGDEGNEIDFLGESEIPRSFEEAQLNEPTVSGPNGTEIGTETGTVRQASGAAPSSSDSRNGTFQGEGQRLGSAGPSSAGVTSPPSNQPAPQSASTAPAAAQATSQPYPKEAVDQLQGLGFSREEAVAALDACGGNVDYAASLLFQS
ncbi:DNA damage-inducible protein 1 [Polychaeton citri CBS 116435]|uniref:DNA damage-inducible protein 1 n=1 Tax=Polychaeton citri CBS 116435 TaxID=1314669 RepID=A0A9P4QJ38_9PEZI|nr:DNA damage-inducible protein 1 [Polychaeton citri CBS 116435]